MKGSLKPEKHARDHRPGGEDPMDVLLERKCITDTTTLVTGDGLFMWAVTQDLDKTFLLDAQAFVTTVSSSGTPTIQIRNVTRTVDLLTTRITIDASEFTSYTAAVPSVVNDTGSPTASLVTRGDILSVDVDVAGSGAKGLGVYLIFGRKPIEP